VGSQHHQGCSPRLCQLRIDGLPPRASIERIDRMLVFMGPVSLVAAINRCLALSPLLQWLARERNYIRTHGSVSRRTVDCVGSPFAWEQWPCLTLLMTLRKIAICEPCEIHIVEGHTQTKSEKRVACWSGFPL
jgi:hypothetical protein